MRVMPRSARLASALFLVLFAAALIWNGAAAGEAAARPAIDLAKPTAALKRLMKPRHAAKRPDRPRAKKKPAASGTIAEDSVIPGTSTSPGSAGFAAIDGTVVEPESEATGINADGLVAAGTRSPWPGTVISHLRGVVFDWGVVHKLGEPAGGESFAKDINNVGTIVGTGRRDVSETCTPTCFKGMAAFWPTRADWPGTFSMLGLSVEATEGRPHAESINERATIEGVWNDHTVPDPYNPGRRLPLLQHRIHRFDGSEAVLRGRRWTPSVMDDPRAPVDPYVYGDEKENVWVGLDPDTETAAWWEDYDSENLIASLVPLPEGRYSPRVYEWLASRATGVRVVGTGEDQRRTFIGYGWRQPDFGTTASAEAWIVDPYGEFAVLGRDYGMVWPREVTAQGDVLGAYKPIDARSDDDPWIAVMWHREDDGTYRQILLDELLPEDSGVHLEWVNEINDRGQAAVSGRNADGKKRGFLLDLDWCTRVCVDPVAIEVQKIGGEDGQFEPVADGVVEGNQVRVKVSVTNIQDEVEEHVDLLARDQQNDGVLLEPWDDQQAVENVRIAPGETHTAYLRWKVENAAFDRDRRPKISAFIKPEVREHDDEAGANGALLDERLRVTKVRPRPVVMVHGMAADHETWRHGKDLINRYHPNARAFAVGDRGPRWGQMDTGSWARSALEIALRYGVRSPSLLREAFITAFLKPGTIRANAQVLKQYVDNVRRETGAQQVDLIGSSMGGLIGRRYIDTYMTESDAAVHRLLTFATPHTGSPCASILPVAMTRELTPESVYRFNQEVTNRRGVTFSALASIFASFTCQNIGEPGDLVVSCQSAVANIDDRYIYDGPWHRQVGNDDGPWLDFAFPTLGRSTGGAPHAAACPGAAPSKQADAPAPVPDGAQLLFDDVVGDFAATVSEQVIVPEGASRITISALQAPGQVIRLRNAAGEVVAEQADGELQTTMSAIVSAGRYTLELTGGEGREYTVGKVAVTAAPLTATVGVDEVRPEATGALKITTSVRARPAAGEPEAPVNGLDEVPVRIESEDDPRTVYDVIATDDANGTTGDGIYGVTSEPLPSGTYYVKPRVTIKDTAGTEYRQSTFERVEHRSGFDAKRAPGDIYAVQRAGLSGYGEIVQVDDAGEVHPTGVGANHIGGPVLSPDGTRLAVVREDHLDVWRLDGSAEPEVWVARGVKQESRPSWSRDGSKLLWIGRSGDRPEGVYMSAAPENHMPSDPGEPVRAGTFEAVTYSPTHERFAYTGGQGVYLHDMQTGESTRVIAPVASPIGDLQFSPNGRQLVLVTGAGEYVRSNDVAIIDTTRPRAAMVTSDNEWLLSDPPEADANVALNDATPGWSPDGQWVVWSSPRADVNENHMSLDYGLWIARPNGTARMLVAGASSSNKVLTDPVWAVRAAQGGRPVCRAATIPLRHGRSTPLSPPCWDGDGDPVSVTARSLAGDVTPLENGDLDYRTTNGDEHGLMLTPADGGGEGTPVELRIKPLLTSLGLAPFRIRIPDEGYDPNAEPDVWGRIPMPEPPGPPSDGGGDGGHHGIPDPGSGDGTQTIPGDWGDYPCDWDPYTPLPICQG